MQAHTNKTGRCVRGGKSGWRTQPNHQNYSSLSQRRASERGREREGERKKERERARGGRRRRRGGYMCLLTFRRSARVWGGRVVVSFCAGEAAWSEECGWHRYHRPHRSWRRGAFCYKGSLAFCEKLGSPCMCIICNM